MIAVVVVVVVVVTGYATDDLPQGAVSLPG